MVVDAASEQGLFFTFLQSAILLFIYVHSAALKMQKNANYIPENIQIQRNLRSEHYV